MSEVSAIGYAIDFSAVVLALGLFAVVLGLQDIRNALRDLAEALRDGGDDSPPPTPLLSTRARPFSEASPSSSK